MSASLEQNFFVQQLQENQNIIHTNLYTSGDDEHKDLFLRKLIQLWKAFRNSGEKANFQTWACRLP
jgi:RNA polymerase sigma-70 factor (ECF subfamily)